MDNLAAILVELNAFWITFTEVALVGFFQGIHSLSLVLLFEVSYSLTKTSHIFSSFCEMAVEGVVSGFNWIVCNIV